MKTFLVSIALLILFSGQTPPPAEIPPQEIIVTSEDDTTQLTFNAVLAHAGPTVRGDFTTPHTFKTQGGAFVLYLSGTSKTIRLYGVMREPRRQSTCTGTGTSMSFFFVKPGSGGVYVGGGN